MPANKHNTTKKNTEKASEKIPFPLKGITNGYGRVATERAIIIHTLERLNTEVDQYQPTEFKNTIDERRIGLFRAIIHAVINNCALLGIR